MEIEELIVIVEKNKTSLSKLEDNFYEKVRKKVEELEKMKTFGDEKTAERCEDKIKSIQRFLKKIFEMRTSRIISAAWAEVCGQQITEELENMTKAEKEFFKKLVSFIENFRSEVLEGKKEKEIDYILIRIKKDLDIFGVDGKRYKLRREDIATLPKPNAEALMKADLAEKIEVD
ncbi:MAG: hypothetical protein NZ895_04660 [Archaeoglobaceae archaeon]|nr:hypothetical protein [Archaeoglobaceae archaeon]MCX8152629.1 hypothetical protein [Archaeoglobaceae archaeon]MDW8014089.1 hypothetical protein [Archaeoglobaceae archaeon]